MLPAIPGTFRRETHMADEEPKDWKQLCSEASVEQDPEKLLQIIRDLEKALDQRKDGPEDRQRA